MSVNAPFNRAAFHRVGVDAILSCEEGNVTSALKRHAVPTTRGITDTYHVGVLCWGASLHRVRLYCRRPLHTIFGTRCESRWVHHLHPTGIRIDVEVLDLGQRKRPQPRPWVRGEDVRTREDDRRGKFKRRLSPWGIPRLILGVLRERFCRMTKARNAPPPPAKYTQAQARQKFRAPTIEEGPCALRGSSGAMNRFAFSEPCPASFSDGAPCGGDPLVTVPEVAGRNSRFM